ncbi:MAG: TetR/AcrR family transcriptional regulator [Raineya sp.]
MTKREQAKKAKRLKIIEAAEKVFFEKGFQIATMDDVTRQTGFSKATVYSYFPSKDELFFTICQRGNEILQKQLRKATQKNKLGVDKVRAIGWSFFEFALNYPHYYRFISYFVSGSGFAIHEDLEATMLDLDKILEESIQIGIEDGSIKPVNALLVSKCLWAMATGIVDLIFQKGDLLEKYKNIERRSVFQTFYELLEQSLATNLAAQSSVK